MSIPPWLFDELPDDDLVARARAWAELLAGAVEVDLSGHRAKLELVAAMATRYQRRLGSQQTVTPGLVAERLAALEPVDPAKRRAMMQAEADRVHEACWMAGCDCGTPTVGPVPGRCGRCIGVIGGEPLPEREERGGPQMPSYDEVVADFTARSLASHCSCEACSRREHGS